MRREHLPEWAQLSPPEDDAGNGPGCDPGGEEAEGEDGEAVGVPERHAITCRIPGTLDISAPTVSSSMLTDAGGSKKIPACLAMINTPRMKITVSRNTTTQPGLLTHGPPN
jgi:hypothetical protein